MNKIYKLIWNAQVQAYIVTSELARKGGKTARLRLVSIIAVSMATTGLAYAQCPLSAPENKVCTTFRENTPVISTYADTTISDNRIENRDPSNQTINTPDTDLNQSLTIINQNGAGDLTVNANNRNITDIDATNNSRTGAITINTTQDMLTPDTKGIYINSAGTDVTLTTAAVHSKQRKGISIENNGSGSTKITANDDIISDTDDAIYAVNNAGSKDLTINTQAVIGQAHGIYAYNNGTGSTTLIVNKGIESHTTDAIWVNNANISSTNLNVTTHDTVLGHTNGIYAINNGTGDTTIETIQNVQGEDGDGIFSENHGGQLTITSDNIIGTSNGIYAMNSGNGSTDITSTGNVTASSGNGIFVNNGNNTNGLTITTNVISGTDNGIYATNNGTGETRIVNQASVTADKNTGISVTNTNQANGLNIKSLIINAGTNGIVANNHALGDTEITSNGPITATRGYGIWAENGEQAGGIIIRSGGAISGGTSGIKVHNSGSGSTTLTLVNPITGGTEAGIFVDDKPNSKTTITLKTGTKVSAASGLAIRDGDGNANVTLNSGSNVIGRIELGNGSDTLFINRGANISNITVVDGGDDTSSNDGMTDTLNINQSLTGSTTGNNNGVAGNIAILNWEKINLAQNSTLTLSGDLNTNQLNIGNGTTVNLIGSLRQAQINGDVFNSGNINLNSNFTGDNLTINGNYQGNGGKLTLDLKLNSALKDNDSIADNTADKLTVQGNVTGKTTIRFASIDGLGGDTGNTNGIELVKVNGNSTGDAFALEGDHLDRGAYEYHLFKGDLQQNGNNWYLRSQKQTNPGDDNSGGDNSGGDNSGGDNSGGNNSGGNNSGGNNSGGNNSGGNNSGGNNSGGNNSGGNNSGNGNSGDSGTTTKPSKLRPLYRKEVPLFAAVASQLRQADSLMLANMHQRIGSTPLPDERMSWGRVIASRTDIQQNGPANARTTGNYAGLQLGSDIWSSNGWRAGGYVGYLHGNLDVDGFTSGINTRAGKNTTKSYFIGAYGNYTRENGAYADFVVQGARHHVDIKPDNNPSGKQKGHGVTASVEIGQPFTLGSSNWKLEPQAQIIHQWLDLNDSDISGRTTVSHGHNNAWLFRLGGRLEGSYQLNKGSLRPYARVNFFYSPDGADHTSYITNVATTRLNAGASHASTELAIGGTYDITNKVKAYGEIGHTWSNGGDAHTKAPVNGSVGLKINW
ncbi:autotransporter outer membrane beta-barrel domain-containing protein [Snodgrassella alvi]|uniref:autotransporter outer membrane beta-barrel domain-containing protein n=1 Tax=Snodgrassella alvi TaxID=1196083 RepID=UPI0027404CD8|nr:autotransporter outer membrane beta-barrel domain-containing protein [Snodgrassella alvi]WLT02618.1 autotransporter outer membrane beta-barrel domain-containing protein [Snodgrassella alvi]